mmetsp:Transcript_1985/g.2830  ORF Transcript_1985/g.2830 Transcript_1985/m.2830 type:complete len:213 (+) Transcript_1985:449-1087(+)
MCQKNILMKDKVLPIVEYVCSVSQAMVHTLGSLLSLDEMMIRFFGKSIETHRMKNKPIKEGFKLFVLTTKNGYILNFMPDGRVAASTGKQEYTTDRQLGEIESMILFVSSYIDSMKRKQMNRMSKTRNATKRNVEANIDESMLNKFCLAMDNYFTLPCVIKTLRNKEIGIVGTARYRGRSCPPQMLKDVSQDDANFNDFYWTVDEFGTLVAR